MLFRIENKYEESKGVSMKKQIKILKTNINVMDYDSVLNQIDTWTSFHGEGKYVCICNTHSLVTAYENKKFKLALDNADLCTPDGMPLVWISKKNADSSQNRVDGPKLMQDICLNKNYRIYLFGSTPEVLSKITKKIKDENGKSEIVGSFSPPFRKLKDFEKTEIINNINQVNPDIVLVGLGCPKQEIWMYENSGNINSILIGVGAGFNYFIGDIKRAPTMLQKIGFEWLYRLIQEPRRLTSRYLINNSKFIFYLFLEKLRRDK